MRSANARSLKIAGVMMMDTDDGWVTISRPLDDEEKHEVQALCDILVNLSEVTQTGVEYDPILKPLLPRYKRLAMRA